MRAEAYETAVRQHKDGVHGYAAKMLRDRDEALDVAQESLIRLWSHREKVDEAGARAWLMRTAHNLCIDRIRRRQTRNEVDDGETVVAFKSDSAPDPERLVASNALGDRIEAALQRMAPVDRAVLVMREIQELPYSEIADVLEMPLGTVKARLHRARERLRGMLVREGVGPQAAHGGRG